MYLLIQIIIAIIVAVLIALLSRHWDETINPIIPIIAAIGGVIVTYLYDIIGKKIHDPNLSIKFHREVHYIDLNISKIKNHVKSLTLDIPILGIVKEITNLSSISDADPPIQQITNLQNKAKEMVNSVENRKANYQNRIELIIKNIKPKKNLNYRIFYEPNPDDLIFDGNDICNISYSWQFNGNILDNTYFISIKNSKKVPKPKTEIKDFMVVPLKPDETKQILDSLFEESDRIKHLKQSVSIQKKSPLIKQLFTKYEYEKLKIEFDKVNPKEDFGFTFNIKNEILLEQTDGKIMLLDLHKDQLNIVLYRDNDYKIKLFFTSPYFQNKSIEYDLKLLKRVKHNQITLLCSSKGVFLYLNSNLIGHIQ